MILENLTIFDYTILTIISISTIFAFIKGFIRSIVTIIGWIIVVVITYYSSPYISVITSKFVNGKNSVFMISNISTFIISLVITSIFTGQLNEYTRNVRGGLIDRIFGMGFGFIRGYLFALLIFNLAIASWKIFIHSDDDLNIAPKWLKSAKTYEMLNTGSEIIKKILPNKVQKDLDKIGKYKDIESLVSKDQVIDKILDSLPKELKNSVSPDYLEKLKNENTSDSEKTKIIQLIKKLDKDKLIDNDLNKLIDKLVINNEEDK